MSDNTRDLKRGDCLSPTDFALLANPLDFLEKEHLREREICTQLDELVNGVTADADAASCILAFLRDELPVHLQDVDEDLFPLLRRRCEPEDQIGKAIECLTSGHRHTRENTPRVVFELERLCLKDGELATDNRSRLARFATHARRHLILENAIILPFARLRLTNLDLETLRLRMMQRRGVGGMMKTADVE